MTLILDAAPLIALMDRADPARSAVRRILIAESGDLILPAPVSAEVDYLTGQRLGRRARRAFIEDLAVGRFQVICLTEPEYDLVLRLDEEYSDFDVGLADLSVVVLAHRYRTRRILTFDRRHFRALRAVDGGAFELLPEDMASR